MKHQARRPRVGVENQAWLPCAGMKDLVRLPYVAPKNQALAVVMYEFPLRRFSVKDQFWLSCAGVDD